MDSPRAADDARSAAERAAADNRFVRRAGIIVLAIQIALLLATLALTHA